MDLKTIELDNLKISVSPQNIKNLLGEFSLLLFLNFVLAKFFLPTLWAKDLNVLHTTLELVCIFIALATFLVVWHTFERNPPLNHIICFGFLMVSIFEIFHLYFALFFDFYNDQHLDLTLRYLLPCRLLEALTMLMITIKIPGLTINKWLGLFFSLISAVGLSLFITCYPNLLPVLFTQQGPTPAKILLAYLTISIFLLSLYRLKKKINERDLLTYRYIFLALLLTIVGELSFTLYSTVTSFYNLLGHLLRLTSYYYLFQGMFVSAITYPYEKLEKAGQYMANILDDLPLGITTHDHNFRLTFANKKAEEVSSCQKQELYGLSNREIIEMFSLKSQPINSLSEQITLDKGPIRNKLVNLQNCNGINIDLKTDVYKLDNGGFLCLFTEAKKEQELQNLQLQTQTILNSINNSVLVVDKNCKIIMCNKAFSQLVEMEEQSILGLDSTKLNRLLQFNQEGILSRTLRNEKLEKIYETPLITPKGTRKEILFHSAPVINVEGEIIGAIGIASDVTLMKKEQEKIQQREKLACLGQMAAGIVHEIKNPLTTIKGFNQLIQAKIQDEGVRKYCSVIEQEVQEVNNLVTDFLAFAKPRSPELKKIPLNKFLQGMELVLKTQCSAKNIKVYFLLNPEEKPVLVDENQIKQVMINMVKNSLEAMEETTNPKLVISTGLNESMGEMFISIVDNGVGMSKEQQAKVGTPFFTTKDKGTGLGLSICYQIIKEHGGRVEIDSTLGKGTSFTLYLPYQEQG